MSPANQSITTARASGMHGFASTITKRERIPFSSEEAKNRHERTRYAQGWLATYEWEASDGQRDLYKITLTKLEF